MLEMLGLVGILLFLAGLHLLWQAREEILFWMQKYLETFQNALRATTGGEHSEPAKRGASDPDAGLSRPETTGLSQGPAHAMRLMSGFGLLLLGPLLVLLSLFLSL